MAPKRIDYSLQSKSAADILEENEIAGRHVSEEDRRRTYEYLEGMITGKDDQPWEYTLKEVTIVGKGADEASYFVGSYGPSGTSQR